MISRTVLGLLVLVLAAGSVRSAATAPFQFANPVRAGDYPDPSVIRVGADYWATATSGEWAPHFPLLHSRDLVNWEVKGYVFATAPGWAQTNFWAPEIAQDRGKFFIYYTARQISDHRLAVAVASADHPGGPYTDHGPLVAQEAGSIDAVPFTDATGVRWLLWKEDGNSRKIPSLIWLQRLRDDGLALVGERQEILRNDLPWEGGVVEGAFVLRRGGYYYLFYSGASCCGPNCNYALGVARATAMTGPWEKAPANPLLAGNAAWRCPGHGSIVDDSDGRSWLLYHALAQQGFLATGREILLDEVVFGSDGWPSINGGRGPSTRASGPTAALAQADRTRFRADFTGSGELAAGWQWPLGRRPDARIVDGALVLTAHGGAATAVRSITGASFVAETSVATRRFKAGASAGLVLHGDPAGSLALVTDGKKIQVWHQRRGQRTIVAETAAAAGESIRLRVACLDGNRFRFAVRHGDGAWAELTGESAASFLPPWERSVRVGVTVSGADGAAGGFDYFSSTSNDSKLLAP